MKEASRGLLSLRDWKLKNAHMTKPADAANQERQEKHHHDISEAASVKHAALERLDHFNRAVAANSLLRKPGEDAIQYNARVCPLLLQHAEHVHGASLATERERQVELACRPSANRQQHEARAKILGDMVEHIRRKGAAQQDLERSHKAKQETADAIEKHMLLSESGVDLGDSHSRLQRLVQSNWQARIDVGVHEATRDAHHKWLREKNEELMRTPGRL